MEHKTKVYAVAALKGGVGKSTTAQSLAYIYGQHFNKSVLLIDMDSQSSTSIVVGVTPSNYDKRTPMIEKNLSEILVKIKEEGLPPYEVDELLLSGRIATEMGILERLRAGDLIEDIERDLEKDKEIMSFATMAISDGQLTNDAFAVNGVHTLFRALLDYPNRDLTPNEVRDCIYRPVYKMIERVKDENGNSIKDESGIVQYEAIEYEFPFDIMPSTEYLSDIELEWSNTDMKGYKGKQLDKIIEVLEDYFDYDVVIIDCPPSLGLLTVNSLYSAKGGVIVPASQDKQSLFSLERIKNVITSVKLANKGDHNGLLGVLLSIYKSSRLTDQYISATLGHDLRVHVFDTKISESADARKVLFSGRLFAQDNKKAYRETVKLIAEMEERESYLSELRKQDVNCYDELRAILLEQSHLIEKQRAEMEELERKIERGM